ncbi:PadR family transcriptional regulator [Candidatus Aenigmatarchaeota archaeon]
MSISRHILGKKATSEIELGMLQMQILWLLNRTPVHGYSLMKDLSKIKNKKITSGTLYPTLQKLLDMRYIEKKNKKGKIVYNTTKKGNKAMKDACSDFCKTFHGIYQDFVCRSCKKE